MLAGVLSAALVMSFCSFAYGADANFEDVSAENSSLNEAIEVLSEKGIVQGLSNTEFGVDEKVTREQMALFIYRMENGVESSESGKNETAFTDLDDPTYYSAISWASKNGIINGVSETEFEPKGTITLQDCYTMTARATGYDMNEDLAYAKSLGFVGSENLSYPTGYISIAKAKGFDENLNESIEYTDELTRGDVAIILNNVLKAQSKTEKNILDGKKIIFLGNSYIYYGRVVIDQGQHLTEDILQRRTNDYGFFHQLCKQNGADVTVTNWVWGGHRLRDIISGNCAAGRGHDGYNHLEDLRKLSDMNYDYVVMTPGSSKVDVETTIEDIKQIQEIFREANPNTEFILSISTQKYFQKNQTENCLEFIASIDFMEEETGVTVVDWGNVAYDIAKGIAVVENSTQEYNKNSFIVSVSEADGYHPNQLTGYIQAQMLYSAITGEKAEGEEYGFCTDENVNAAFNLENNINSRYKYDNISPEGSEITLTGDDLTNYPEIFKSPTEMLGIQKLIDKYIEEKPYKNR